MAYGVRPLDLNHDFAILWHQIKDLTPNSNFFAARGSR
jgi:hypothetical protein